MTGGLHDNPRGPERAQTEAPRPILVVDDDDAYRRRLVRAFHDRGLPAVGAASPDEAAEMAAQLAPGRAVVDLRMPGGSGLDLIEALVAAVPDVAILMLTGYGSIATAVEAVKRGAVQYLQKPADADEILAAFAVDTPRSRAPSPPMPVQAESGPAASTPSLARVEWEHLQRVLQDCDGNLSEAARRLGMHRRSLQRKLQKFPPRH